MISAVITFIVGIVIGGWVARRRTQHHWQRRVKSIRQDLFAQYTGDVQAEARQRKAAEKIKNQLENSWLAKKEDWTERESSLVKQLKAVKHEQQKQQQDYAQRLETERSHAQALKEQLKAAHKHAQALTAQLETAQKHEHKLQLAHAAKLNEQRTQHLKLQRKHSKHRDEIRAATQSKLEVEKENTTLTYDIKKLNSELKKLRETIQQSEQEHVAALDAIAQKNEPNLAEVVARLFPNVELLRNSVAQLNQHKRDFGAVLAEIQQIVQTGQFIKGERVKGIEEWLEYRPKKMGRIYYRKATSEKYQMLISWKKDDKSQKKDIDWLKHQ